MTLLRESANRLLEPRARAGCIRARGAEGALLQSASLLVRDHKGKTHAYRQLPSYI